MNKPLDSLTNEELWRLFPIIICEHQDSWINSYQNEEEIIEKLIGKENIIRISHIGSTAVAGLRAKPTIDILIEVAQDISPDRLIEQLKSAGYTYSPQPDNPPPHMMFMKGYTSEGFRGQAFHLHVRYSGDWDELYFRDYLLTHPNVAKEYGELKMQLKEKYPNHRDNYTAAKSSFIRKYTDLAKREFYQKYKIKD